MFLWFVWMALAIDEASPLQQLTASTTSGARCCESRLTTSSLRSSSIATSATSVCVLDSTEHSQLALQIAQRLALPLIKPSDLESYPEEDEASRLTHAVSIVPYSYNNVDDVAIGISCFDDHSRSNKKKLSMKPFFVDFCPLPNSLAGKRSSGETGPELLSKAVSPKKGSSGEKGAVVYDLTAGFGQDSLIIANSGAYRVHMVERNPIIATLLHDAIRRLNLLANLTNDKAAIVSMKSLASRLSMEHGDGVAVMNSLSQQSDESMLPDVVYLDPMFPIRRKSAAVKKNMQILHGLLDSQLVSDDIRHDDETALLVTALETTNNRVVVKRPANAPLLGHPYLTSLPRPSFQVMGSVNRWDVYVK
jgi:16S rRNA (guanine1516-N2)-methyltransferase